jgi:hypothetical protein
MALHGRTRKLEVGRLFRRAAFVASFRSRPATVIQATATAAADFRVQRPVAHAEALAMQPHRAIGFLDDKASFQQ